MKIMYSIEQWRFYAIFKIEIEFVRWNSQHRSIIMQGVKRDQLLAGDLFDMLLPMLSIYQEYVRNHHYSLQVLTECKQSSPSFALLLARLENKSACHSRSLETFLTYPMHQVNSFMHWFHRINFQEFITIGVINWIIVHFYLWKYFSVAFLYS